MAAPLVASFVLQLEDRLSNGIVALQRRLAELARLARGVNMPGLGEAGGAMDRAGAAAARMAERVGGIGASARRSADELRRLSAQAAEWVRRAGAASARSAAQGMALGAGVGLAGMGMLAHPELLARMQRWERGPAVALRGTDTAGLRFAALETRLNGMGAAAGRAAERVGLMGSAVAGISLAMPIRAAAQFDQQLRDIAVNADAAGPEAEGMIRRMRGEYNALALRTGQRGTDVADAAGRLVAAGLKPELIGQVMPAIARTATAENASITDLASSAYTLLHNLGVDPAQLERGLGMMVVAGHEGHFELRDMARFMPGMAASATRLGMRGTDAVSSLAAAGQVAMQYAPMTEPGEAATYLRDFMFALSQHTTARSFAKHGVSLEGILRTGAAQGMDPFEIMYAKLRQMTHGMDTQRRNTLLGELFHNQQSAMMVSSLLDHFDDYRRIRGLARGEAADGIVGRDFATQQAGAGRRMVTLEEMGAQVQRRFGDEILRSQTSAPMLALQGLLGGMEWLDKHAPGSVHAIANIGASVIGLVGVLGLVGPVLGRGMGLLGSALFGRLGLLRLAFVGIATVAGAVSAPVLAVGAAVAAVAGAAYLLYQNWDRVGPWLQGAWDGILGGLRGLWDGITGGIGRAWAQFTSVLSADAAACAAAFMRAWEPVREFFAPLWEAARGAFAAFAEWVASWAAGPAAAAVAAVQGKWEVLRGWFAGLCADIQAAFDRIVGPSIPTLPQTVQRGIEQQRENAGRPGNADDWNRAPPERQNVRPGNPDDWSQAPGPNSRQPTANLEGRLRIVIDQNGVARLGQAGTNQPGVSIEVNRGDMRGID